MVLNKKRQGEAYAANSEYDVSLLSGIILLLPRFRA
jgi:hypothetical protein